MLFRSRGTSEPATVAIYLRVSAPTPARTCTPSPSRARHEGRALETPPSSPPSLSTCVPVGSDAGSHKVLHSEPVTSPSRRTHTRGTSEPATVAIYLRVSAPIPARTQSCTPSPSRALHEGRTLEARPSLTPSLSTYLPACVLAPTPARAHLAQASPQLHRVRCYQTTLHALHYHLHILRLSRCQYWYARA